MATKEIKAKDLIRSSNGNGHSEPASKTIRGIFGSSAKVPQGAITPGRQVTRQDLWGVLYGAEAPRGVGRDDATLDLIKTIRDLDPHASHAVWNFLRLCNPGHDLHAFVFQTDGSEILEEGEAQLYLDKLARRVGAEYGGGLDQLHNVLALMAISHGAICAEVAPNDTLDDIIDWYAVDPRLITFRREESEDEAEPGTELLIGQKFADGKWAMLNPEQVVYTPLDPDVDDPYGRPPMLTAIQSVIAKAQLLQDLRAVSHNQGYPRLEVTIEWSAIEKAAPANLRESGNEEAFTTWARSQLQQIVTDFDELEVDDTFIHYDWIKLAMVPGAESGLDFDVLEKVLTRQLSNALKTLPILTGFVEGTGLAHGSIQWQIQVAGIQALQNLIKRTVEKLANTSLRLAGLQAHAKLEYEDIRTIDRLYEAQAEYFESRNAQLHWQMGWIDNDEAAERMVGHAAVADPVPVGSMFVPKGSEPPVVTGGSTGAGNLPADTTLGEGKLEDDLGRAASWMLLQQSLNRSPEYHPLRRSPSAQRPLVRRGNRASGRSPLSLRKRRV